MKTHFTIDTRGNNISWFLIDTETTLANKIRHSACISLHNNLVSYLECDANVKYLTGKDEHLPKPSINDYIKASYVLKGKGLVCNKKIGTVIPMDK